MHGGDRKFVKSLLLRSYDVIVHIYEMNMAKF